MPTFAAGRPVHRGSAAAAVIRVIVGVTAAGVVAALLRWSAWWPHSDMRQHWATFAALAVGAVAVATLAGALLRARALARVAIVVFAGAAVLVGLTVGFGVLQDATASVR